jgi:hypothetical protein
MLAGGHGGASVSTRPDSALSGEVGVATEMLLTKAEQVSDDGPAPPDRVCSGHVGGVAPLALKQQRVSMAGAARSPDGASASGDHEDAVLTRPWR